MSLSGDAESQSRNLSCPDLNNYCGVYDPKLDHSSLNEFSNAAFKVYHANAPNIVNLYSESEYKLNNIYTKNIC